MSRATIIAFVCALFFISELSALGWISPPLPIYARVNDSFQLQCTLNMSSNETRDWNSSHLMFYRGEDAVPPEQVRIINSTTIELTVDHAQPTNEGYTCKVNKLKGIAIRSVYVGYEPREVKDFKCRAPHWDKYMICTFTSQNNLIPTKFFLEFHLIPLIQSFPCPLAINSQTNVRTCVITADKGYRHANENYYFNLTIVNNLGTRSQTFNVNHFDVVIPFIGENCTTNVTSSDSAVLKWRKWYKYEGFKRAFISEVKLLSIYDNNVWQEMSTEGLRLKNMEYTLPLTGLKYAATRYDVRISMRTNSSQKGDDMWSNYTSCLFTTRSRKPDTPPDVAIGSFENSNEHHLFVYWRELQKWQHNAGSGFYYEVTMLGPDENIIEQWSTTGGMVDRNHIQDRNYTFIIRSVNGEGKSDQSSEVFVPSYRHRLAKPVIEKLLSDAGKFTLSWKPPPRDAASITSYTVFWCNTTSNSPNDCNGSINFTTVASNQTTFVLSNAGVTLNFAVAANSGRLSSGMVWAACTATHKTDIGKLKTIWITETVSSSIHLKWKTECGDVAHTGYMIYYCNINEPRMQDCKEPELAINVTNKNQHYCLLENLKPYTTYKIEIAMYSETHFGPRSEPVFNTTRESAPSQPRMLSVNKITKNSVTLHWKPPLHINGGTMSYQLLYNGLSFKHNLEGPYDRDVEETLENLDAFTEYNISVRAYTVDYSPASNLVRVRTLLGEPHTIEQPSTNSSSGSQLKISWNPPSKPSGCVEFYELRIVSKNIKTYRQRNTGCQLQEAICQTQDSSKYEFLVRAVNVDIVGEGGAEFESLSCADRWEEIQKRWPALKSSIANEKCGVQSSYSWDSDLPPEDIRLLRGPWSVPLAHWCSMADGKAMYLPTIVTLIILILCFFLLSYSYVRVKHVLQVEVIIPDGLNDMTGATKQGFNVISAGGLIFTEHTRDGGNIITGCTKDEGYTKEQNQCLLPSSSSTGGSIADLSGHDQHSSRDFFSNSGCCEEDSASFYDQEAERQDLHGFGDEASDTIDSNNIDDVPQQSRSVSAQAEGSAEQSSFGNSCKGNSGGVSGTPRLLGMMMMDGGGNQSKPTAVPATVSSGYVPAPTVNPIKQPPTNSSGYLQIGALTKAGILTASMDSAQKSYNAKMAAAPISGYVTHKQLSDYGQNLQ